MTYLFGNWKMYLSVGESHLLAERLAAYPPVDGELALAVFPNTLVFQNVAAVLQKSRVAVGAQDTSSEAVGAFTGATAPQAFVASGATYALAGHSERRHVFGETNEDVRKKIEKILEVGLIPVLCIGETKEDVDTGNAELRLQTQIKIALEGLVLEGREMIIAYEPVWAISKGGNGAPCSAEKAEETHIFIRKEIAQYTDVIMPVLYGGSVSPDNILSYVQQPHVGGVLVGHASVDGEKWRAMVEAVQHI